MLNKTFFSQNKYRIIGAGIGVLLHSLVLGLVIAAGGRGDAGLLVVFMDFPLTIIASYISLREKYNVILYGLGGTMMYGLLGWLVGILFEKLFNNPSRFPSTND